MCVFVCVRARMCLLGGQLGGSRGEEKWSECLIFDS